MPAIIIYATDASYLDKTINSILDHTNIHNIIVCDDAGLNWTRDGVFVQTTDRVGRAKAWNLAASKVDNGIMVFMKDKVKVGCDWFGGLEAMLIDDHRRLVGPITHTLDLSLWMAESGRWKRFGWRWDLRLYDRACLSGQYSPSISSSCFACTKDWFSEIGGFDDGMQCGAGEDIEVSLRSWLFGGSVAICDGSVVAVGFEADYNNNTINNLSRIIEAWLPEHASLFYDLTGTKASSVSCGRLNNLLALTHKKVRSVDWFLQNQQPELLGVYRLRNIAAGKRVAIVAPGPSLDYVSHAEINRCDIVIGVDFVGLILDCDYVIAESTHVINELRAKYSSDKFLVPIAIQDRTNATLVAADKLIDGAIQFETNVGMIGSVNPPFCDANHLIITASHIALFMGPDDIMVFGFDGKLIDGKSHTTKIEHYDGGKVWSDTEDMRRQFAVWEHWFDQLGKLASAVGIPILRVSHA